MTIFARGGDMVFVAPTDDGSWSHNEPNAPHAIVRVGPGEFRVDEATDESLALRRQSSEGTVVDAQTPVDKYTLAVTAGQLVVLAPDYAECGNEIMQHPVRNGDYAIATYRDDVGNVSRVTVHRVDTQG